MNAGRQPTITQKVKTPFGSMYVHLDHDGHGRVTGGSISHPGKDPDSSVADCLAALSAGLDLAIKSIGRRE